MRNPGFRFIAAILGILLLTGVPTHAAPIVVSDVIQVVRNYQNPPDLRLRSISKNSASPAPGKRSSIDGSLEIPDSSVGGLVGPTSHSLLAGVAIGSDPPAIDVIAEGDVEGTVCDCGEITVAGGGWPKWPLLLLGAIPFFFIDDDCDICDTPLPTPTPPVPTPTPIPTPEPASLLLFGTGLAAFTAAVRRRYSRSRLMAQNRSTEEEG